MFDAIHSVWGVSGFSFFVMIITFVFSFFIFTVRKFQAKKALLFSAEAAIIAEPFAGLVHFLVTRRAPDGEGSDFFLVYFSALVFCLAYLLKELPWAEKAFRPADPR